MKTVGEKPVHVIIPAYEEEKSIGRVVEGLKRLNLDLEVWVVDDGSKDGTAEEARKAGGRVIRHFVNLGQWAALRTGFTAAIMEGAEILVSIDADGQHDPGDLPRLVETINGNDVDLAIGSRFMEANGPDMPRYRRWGIHFFNKLMETSFKCRLTDCTSGYKAYKADLIKKMLPASRENQYGALEFIANAVKLKAKITEVPIKSIKNISSKKGNLRYGYNLLRTVIKSILAK